MNKPRIEFRYCTQCRWLLRAAWMAQELLTTFEKELGEVALVPGEDQSAMVKTPRECRGVDRRPLRYAPLEELSIRAQWPLPPRTQRAVVVTTVIACLA